MYKLLTLILFIPFANSYLSPSFFSWINTTYGESMAKRLNRGDLGRIGSYGGGNHTGKRKTRYEPIVVVHGVISTADSFGRIGDYFLENGYREDEVYSTTWGNGANDDIANVNLDCEHVKQVRYFIQAVSKFTQSKVDVLAFSMGSPVARKAVYGHKCVETGENLGPSLTRIVDTFIGVAGANHGAMLCELWTPTGTCNALNGLHCDSLYLKDINSNRLPHYEGRYVYSIYSWDDDMVGGLGCGTNLSAIPHADQTFTFDDMNHEEVMYGTTPLQYSLVTRHTSRRKT